MVEVVIPTKNDLAYLERNIKILKKFSEITSVCIVDNFSEEKISNKIKTICNTNNCTYIFCKEIGKGNAINNGIKETKEDILFLDADIENLNSKMIKKILENNSYDLVKANFTRKNGQSNSAFVLDEIKKRYPNLKIQRPTSGIYLVKRKVLKKIIIPPSWSVDLSILLQTYLKGFSIIEVDLGIIQDKPRSISSLSQSKSCLIKELETLEVLKNGKYI